MGARVVDRGVMHDITLHTSNRELVGAQVVDRGLMQHHPSQSAGVEAAPGSLILCAGECVDCLNVVLAGHSEPRQRRRRTATVFDRCCDSTGAHLYSLR